MNRVLRYLVLSDIHLGHKRNKTESIIASLNALIDRCYQRDDLDIIFLAGDVFDSLLDFPDEEVGLITLWVCRLMEYCSVKNVKLRVLEGTPSHDWGQSKIFLSVQQVSKLKIDLQYVTTLSIETMVDWDLTILYVPDEWTTSADKTLEQVKQLMNDQQLDQVDIAIMHGNFGYQLVAQAVHAPRHDEHEYLRLVRHYISIGHFHTSSVYERILAQGSWDRLAHGEEEAKGCMECVIRPDGNDEFYFIENTQAKRFVTLVLKAKDIDATIQYIGKKTKSLPIDSYVRLKASKHHPALIGFDELKKHFPFFYLSKLTLEEEEDLQRKDLIDEVCSDESKYVPITITSDNLQTLLFDEIRDKYQLSVAQWDIAETALKPFL